MRKLTKREGILLYVLGILVIIIVGWLLVTQPALENTNKKKIDASEAQSKYLLAKEEYRYFSEDVKPNIETKMNEVSEIVARFSPVRANEAIDTELTTLVRNYLMTPKDLTIAGRKREAIVSLNERMELAAAGEELPKDKDGNPTGPQCDVIYVNLRVGGDINKVAFLANDINTREYMRVSALNIDNKKGEVVITIAIYVIPQE